MAPIESMSAIVLPAGGTKMVKLGGTAVLLKGVALSEKPLGGWSTLASPCTHGY